LSLLPKVSGPMAKIHHNDDRGFFLAASETDYASVLDHDDSSRSWGSLGEGDGEDKG
jgi:hypothetical protein